MVAAALFRAGGCQEGRHQAAGLGLEIGTGVGLIHRRQAPARKSA